MLTLHLKPDTVRLLSHLDMPAVEAAMRGVPGVPEWEYDSLWERVHRTLDAFATNDLANSERFLVEQRFEAANGFRGVLDLVLVTGTRAVIVDWKSTYDCTRPNYREELKAEFQTSAYLTWGTEWLKAVYAITDVAYLEYRVVDEKNNKIITLTEQPGDAVEDDARATWSAVQAVYTSQRDLEIWQRRKPRACFGYKTQCEFWEDCTHADLIPLGLANVEKRTEWLQQVDTPWREHEDVWFESKRPRSKSAVNEWLNCSEKYRRTRLLAEEGCGRPVEVLLGEAFHAALANVYGQIETLRSRETSK